MKQNKNKNLRLVADKIWKLEQEENTREIEKIVNSLTLEDMLYIDNYISEKYLTNK